MILLIPPILVFITIALLVWATRSPEERSMEGRLRKYGYLPTAR